jgi:SAM-dependent methyltransferase
MDKFQKIQREYYAKTAKNYDRVHLGKDDAHYEALRYIEQIASDFGLGSFLDVGCGTGRAVEFFLNKGIKAVGIDPSAELRKAGVERNGQLKECLFDGDAYHIPYPDQSFDAVCAFGVMHHVERPSKIIKEMLRVARKAVFISDANRFGQGAQLLRHIKVILWKLRLWPLVNYFKTGGKGFIFTEGDGPTFSYSVYDSLEILIKAKMKILEISTDRENGRQLNGSLILKSASVLLAGIKE